MLQTFYEFNLSYFGLLPGRLPRLVSTYPLIIFSLVIDKGLEGSMNWCSLCNSECQSSAIETFLKISYNSPLPPSSSNADQRKGRVYIKQLAQRLYYPNNVLALAQFKNHPNVQFLIFTVEFCLVHWCTGFVLCPLFICCISPHITILCKYLFLHTLTIFLPLAPCRG